MKPTEVLKPLGVFVLVIAVVLAGTAILSVATGSDGSGPTDGQQIQGQSPGQFQPDAVNAEADPEEGELGVDAPEGEKKILIDTSHGNTFDRAKLEPVLETLAEAGHTVDIGAVSGGGFGSGDYNATLQEYDALLVIQPGSGFSDGQRTALQKYTDGGGRVVVLGEPTQSALGQGTFGLVPTRITFGANGMTTDYGARMGADLLYNMDDSANDNNFKEIYAEPTGNSPLTEGVETVTFSRAGYIVTVGDTDASVVLGAADGTRTLEDDRTGSYATAVQNGNMVFVADSDFITRSELYDVDNEVFVSNLLNFLVSGDKPDDIPSAPGQDDGGF